jgi:tripartite-type tricarboxylate transporter receptor subunit TctC
MSSQTLPPSSAQRRQLLRAGAACAMLGPFASRATAYPSRPVTIVVPFAAGGPADGLARAIAEDLRRRLGQPFVLDFRAGAGGGIGAGAAAKAPADGHTLLFSTSDTLVNNVALYRHLPYDPRRDFAFITQVGSLPLVLATHGGLPVSNPAEFAAAARALGGKISYGSGGGGTLFHLAGEVLLNRRLGLDATHVPYRGVGPMTVDLVGRQITAAFGLMPAYRGFAADGRLRMLGVTGDTAVAEVPQVRTFTELGYVEPILRMRPWAALLAPAGTDRHIVDLLNAAVIAALDAPEVRDMLDASGFQRIANSPQAAHAALEHDLANVLPLIRELGIDAQ